MPKLTDLNLRRIPIFIYFYLYLILIFIIFIITVKLGWDNRVTIGEFKYVKTWVNPQICHEDPQWGFSKRSGRVTPSSQKFDHIRRISFALKRVCLRRCTSQKITG